MPNQVFSFKNNVLVHASFFLIFLNSCHSKGLKKFRHIFFSFFISSFPSVLKSITQVMANNFLIFGSLSSFSKFTFFVFFLHS